MLPRQAVGASAACAIDPSPAGAEGARDAASFRVSHPPTADDTPGAVRAPMSRGVGWSVFGQFGAQAINFVANLALAIPLGPKEFGVIGFAWAVMLLFDALIDFGTGTALVQRPSLTQKAIDTALCINIACAAFATACVVGIGFGVHGHVVDDDGREFDGPTTAFVLWLLSPACIATTLGGIHRALLQRDLRLDTIAKVQLATAAARGGISLALACLGFGVVSLAVGYLAGSLVSIAGYWLGSRRPLHLRYDRTEGRDLLRLGLHLTAYNLLHTALQRVDAFVLSATLGQSDFGLFTLARQLLLQTVEIGGMVSRTVLLPHLARLQGRARAARVAYLRCDQMLAGVMAPLLVVLALLIEPLAAAVLPAKWAPVGAIAPLLLPAALLTLLLQNPGSSMVASGRTQAMPRWGLWRGLAMVVACTTGLVLPLSGVVLALGALLFVTLPMLLAEPARILQASRWTLFRSLADLLLPTLAACAATRGLQAICVSLTLPPVVMIGLAGSGGLAAFVSVAMLLRTPFVKVLRRQLRRRARPISG